MQLLAVILGFGGWNFAGDIIMNHIIYFLLLQLDPEEKVKFSNTLLIIIIQEKLLRISIDDIILNDSRKENYLIKPEGFI